ncbi:MAG: hypothetical protein SGI90_16605 [Candidatus Eisenbacteria bacterium]|nr:hypothetical protein [Candidatus Eisenbacteria bacterium]
MNIFEEFEMLASAFVDDELNRDETVTLLDHLGICETCRCFYRQARSLGDALSASPVPAILTDKIWQRIESRAQRRPMMPAWGVRAAAGILVAVLVWQVAQFRFPPLQDSQPIEAGPEESGPIQLSLEESKGAMSDDRFIELTSEILRADRRYHTAMLQVMADVNQATGIARLSEESTSSENEHGETGGEWNEREVES